LVRAATELPKPNGQRLREFADSKLPELKQDLFSEAPIYDELEIAMLSFHLNKMREELLVDHPLVKKLLGSKSPDQVAQDLVRGTKLRDVKFRRQLFEGGLPAIEASKDPLIQFYRTMEPEARALRLKFEDEIEAKIKLNDEKVARAQFAIYGTQSYPDATFTLRASYGQVRGWNVNGKWVPPFTDLQGAFERHTGADPFALPDSWLKNKNKLDLATHFNFVTTNDIVGGNSGSPVINQNAEVVGLIFDGNIESLGNDYGFNEEVSRAVAVDSQALIETLDKIYGAKRVIEDIRGPSKQAQQ
jgi:hypothetical protein